MLCDLFSVNRAEGQEADVDVFCCGFVLTSDGDKIEFDAQKFWVLKQLMIRCVCLALMSFPGVNPDRCPTTACGA
jgi:hypothetical protein